MTKHDGRRFYFDTAGEAEKFFGTNKIWGTYGKNREFEPKARWMLLADLDTDHLQNILETQHHIRPNTRKIIVGLIHNRVHKEYVRYYE